MALQHCLVLDLPGRSVASAAPVWPHEGALFALAAPSVAPDGAPEALALIQDMSPENAAHCRLYDLKPIAFDRRHIEAALQKGPGEEVSRILGAWLAALSGRGDRARLLYWTHDYALDPAPSVSIAPLPPEGEGRFETPSGECCLKCGGAIVEVTVREAGEYDHWYECEACGCACPDCRRPMAYMERDTSSGSEYWVYRCPTCRREGTVRKGIAMWKALMSDRPRSDE